MNNTLGLLKQLADGLAVQFGSDCEVVIHDLTKKDLEHSIVYIVNGHITNRNIGDGASAAVLESLGKHAKQLNDHLGYLTRTTTGKTLKSSTMYIRDETDSIQYLLSINYDITGLIAIDRSIHTLIATPQDIASKPPEPIVHSVNDILDHLISQSTELIGKPPAMMQKEERIQAIQFLNDAGAFLITKSGDKISQHFGISKFTLYSYLKNDIVSEEDSETL